MLRRLIAAFDCRTAFLGHLGPLRVMWHCSSDPIGTVGSNCPHPASAMPNLKGNGAVLLGCEAADIVV